MRIGDAAGKAGLTPRALRYYEEQGLVAARRTPSGHRVYGPDEVRRLRTVRELLEAGLTVSDLRTLAPLLDAMPGHDAPGLLRDRGPGPQRTVEHVARRRLDDLDARIERLVQLRERLAAQLGAPARAPGRVAPYEGTLRE
uniref:MerR family transcriptional regulator n=1 Tax=Streptomyces sp. NBC_00003 TaxID=2903608 RepID=A0AAU2UZW1_9ACTN